MVSWGSSPYAGVATAEFDYRLPKEAIAQQPVEPRHASRLLDTRDLSDHLFIDLPALLRPGDLVVVNRTRVRRARLHGHKVGSGGEVEVLLLRRLGSRWQALVKPARRLRLGVEIDFGEIRGRVVGAPEGGIALLELEAGGDIEAAIEATGEIPLPPYLHAAPADPDRYQTIFADRLGSAAAPTAGLHFSGEVIKALGATGIAIDSLDLEVGLDTFRSIEVDALDHHRIHAEWYRLDPGCARSVAATRARGGRVVAIGTTVVRVLENCAASKGNVESGEGWTDLFIRPGHEFRVVDAMVTNFHMPRSTPLVLVAALMGTGWQAAYQTALERRYRFLSFGDAMYCERG
jgi:S-adenosylmethionine:tRNA ribosyltransferase-isomerase